MYDYDYLIVGAGLFGAVFAREASDRGKKCLILERRSHVGGNIRDIPMHGINVHLYGAHIFHTSDSEVWEYVNRFAAFEPFINAPVALSGGRAYNLPFNMNTFNQLWGTITPKDAMDTIRRQVEAEGIVEPRNLEEQALSMVGRDIYETLIRDYTQKQWGRPCRELPAFIIKRLPLRFTYDNNYFNDRYQGIPAEGYTAMIQNMLEGVEVRLDTDYADFAREHGRIAETTVYTGAIDEYYGYRLGTLEYRSLRFDIETLDCENHQGNAVVNYCDAQPAYTRIIEHKHFTKSAAPVPKTVISREYPAEWTPGMERYYPVNDPANSALYARYRAEADGDASVRFEGRLGRYAYFDMDKTVAAALGCFR